MLILILILVDSDVSFELTFCPLFNIMVIVHRDDDHPNYGDDVDCDYKLG